ncbi:MAG: hypothetical protein WCA31_04010, partial [Acidimicrobiales bacterium]
MEVETTTSLAELPNYVTRKAAPGYRDPPRLAFSARNTERPGRAATLCRVNDEAPEPDFSEEAAYLHSTPVEVILANHLFVLLQVAALRL